LLTQKSKLEFHGDAMATTATFSVDPRLASILGETYKSTERAVKELVDNAWDADADNVWVELPKEMNSSPIVIADDGTGMTEDELRMEYLSVARDRRTHRGELTSKYRRTVKGRKGIGKFAGLMAAETMTVSTHARGRKTTLTIPRKQLIQTHADFEKIKLPIHAEDCKPDSHGTEITLSDLNRRLSHPNPEKLKQILVLDYGREPGISIFVNGERVTINDIPGEGFEDKANVPQVGSVRLFFKITEAKHPVRQAGIVVKIGDKTIGEPSFFGLDKQDDVPQEVLRRLYGEVHADGLADDVTADWAAIVENSTGYAQVEAYVQQKVRAQLESTFEREFNLLHARIRQEVSVRVAKLPEYRREFAHKSLERVLRKFYGESEDKIRAIVAVVLEALERDEYWNVVNALHHSEPADVEKFAEALAVFGLMELALVARQTKNRQELLDKLDLLIATPATLEKHVHLVIEQNLWVLGSRYALLTSNKTLGRTIEEYTNEKFKGANAKKRPDLLLLNRVDGKHLLIEFKRPKKELDRDDEAQAQKYRDELGQKFHPMDILLIGGTVDKSLRLNSGNGIEYVSFADLISRARTELDWLLGSLKDQKYSMAL
jgi:hypothetical protein